MLLIVDLLSKGETFPLDALTEIDTALADARFRKEVRSVIKPGKALSVTYDGPTIDKKRVEEMLRPIAERNGITFTVEAEESVKFP
jgi:putative aminopeptidase FrvX